jgi:Spy/CpxP family protein refolding chaperone
MFRALALPALAAAALLLPGCLDTHNHEPAQTTNAYVDLRESPIRGLTPAEIDELRSGGGMGLALPAELNGYPGPKHVLDLADQLSLDAATKAAFQSLYERTQEAARAAGARVLSAHESLDQAFRTGAIDEDSLTSRTVELGVALGELRRVHLAAHLEAYDLLTPHQRALYMEYRGYGAADHGQHEH